MKARILSLFLVASGSLGMGTHQSFAAGILYGTDTSSDQLITISQSTGAGTAVGLLGLFSLVEGLAYNSDNGILHGTDVGTNQLITINPSTGLGTVVGALGFGGVEGLAFGPEAAVIPEPSSTLLFSLGALGLLARRRRH